MGTGAWFPFSAVIIWLSIVLPVFLCDGPWAVLSGQSTAKLSPSWPSLIRLVLPSPETRGKANLYRFFPPGSASVFPRQKLSFTMWFSHWQLVPWPAISLHLFLSPSAALIEAFVAEGSGRGIFFFWQLNVDLSWVCSYKWEIICCQMPFCHPAQCSSCWDI